MRRLVGWAAVMVSVLPLLMVCFAALKVLLVTAGILVVKVTVMVSAVADVRWRLGITEVSDVTVTTLTTGSDVELWLGTAEVSGVMAMMMVSATWQT